MLQRTLFFGKLNNNKNFIRSIMDIPQSKKVKVSTEKMTMNLALQMCQAVVNESKERSWGPVAVSVVDASGFCICSMFMDNTAIAMSSFALAKATTAVTMKMSSRKFRDTYNTPEKSLQMMSMIASMQGKICNFPGSILLTSADDVVVGSIGVSGARSDQDEWLALNAVRASGFEGKYEPVSNPMDVEVAKSKYKTFVV